MSESVSRVLEHRLEAPVAGSFRRGVIAALTVHLVLIAAAWLIPRWTQSRQPPIQYVAVQIVPAARLGIEKPPPKSEPPKLSQPAPKPKTVSQAPVLPAPRKSVKKPVPKPEPPKPPPQNAGSPTGSAAGLAMAAPIATLDNPDFTYGYYVDQMLAQISRNWARPPVGSGIQAVIHYRIQRDGRITEVEIAQSSGITSFDLAALRAVESSSPLPPLPRAYRETSLGVNLIVR